MTVKTPRKSVFNLMNPADLLLGRMIPNLKKGGQIMIIDGNADNIYSNIIPSRRRPGVLSPLMMRKRLEALGCKVISIETHCAVPPFVFELQRLQKLMLKIEEIIKPSRFHRLFSVSYTIVSEKV